MENHDQGWLYSELLDLLKKKEKEKEDAYYRPIELELPFIDPPTSTDGEKTSDEKSKERGVIIIDP